MQCCRCLNVSQITKHLFKLQLCSLKFSTDTNAAFRNSVVPNRSGTFQQILYYYLHRKDYWQEITRKLTSPRLNKDFKDVEDFLEKIKINPVAGTVDDHILQTLPSYIATMKNRRTPKEKTELCDIVCSDIFDLNFSTTNVSSLEFLHGWLHHYHPYFHQVSRLMCFRKLLQYRCREVLSLQEENNFSQKIVHLTFFAGIGKKSFESHEVLNQIATYCDSNVNLTYKTLNPLELAIVCEGFFKGGIRIESEKSLSIVLTVLCNFLEETMADPQSQKPFYPFITISLLKILRQVNYIDSKLLRLLGELVLNPLYAEEMYNIRFLINIISAFAGPGRKLRHPVPDSNSDLSMEKILQRMETLIVNILQEEQIRVSTRREKAIVGRDSEEESAVGVVVMKSRLKDISRWLWTTAALGYQMRPSEIYLRDLSLRFDTGQFHAKPGDAVDALLALAIMNQYPDAIVLKILASADFRSSVKVNCSNRHKGRLGLFLTSLRIERSSLWKQLSREDERQWFEAVRTSFTITEDSQAWSSVHRPVKLLQVPGIKSDFKPHTQLLNLCMDALNKIFSKNCSPKSPSGTGSIGNFANENVNYGKKITLFGGGLDGSLLDGMGKVDVTQVLIGYAVPFLFIPGIKIILKAKKEVYLEVLDDVGLSSTYHSFKIRLMEKTNCNILKVSREELENLDFEGAVELLQSRTSGLQEDKK